MDAMSIIDNALYDLTDTLRQDQFPDSISLRMGCCIFFY